jgi:hypothetical protein
VTVKVTPPPDRDPGWTPGYSQEPNGTWIETGAQGERRIIRDPDELAYVTGAPNPDPDTYHHYFTADLWPVVTAEQDAARHLAGDGPIDVGDPSAWRLNPLIGADWRANALREAGYKGPIDQDGHARASMELGSRELTADEIYAAIAAGGYPPGTDPGPVPGQEAIDRRKAALRAAGWAGPISGDGHAIHGQPSYGGLAGALAAIEELATSPRSCCMCVPDPTESEWDQVCDCRCVVGEGAPRDQCTCGPWDLDKALAEDDAAEDRGDLDGDDRATCHQCKDWADHAHAPFSGQRVPKTTYYLQQELLRHPRWQEWQADPDPSAWTVATAATQSPVGHPADGSGPPAPDGSTNKDQENDMPQGSTMTMKTGSDGTTVEGDTQVGGELTAIGDLAAENEQQTTYVQAIQVMKEDLHGWTKGLAEQVDGADWGTAEVSAAAAALSEAQSVGQIREGITSLIAAGEQAKQLGELLDAGGARGKVSGLRPR